MRMLHSVVTIALCLGSYSAAADTWEWSEDNWRVSADVVEGKPFTMSMYKGQESATAQGVITRDGNKFTIIRTQSTDQNHRDCTYEGQIESDGHTFSGTYVCTNNKKLPFRGRILAVGQTVQTWTWEEDNWWATAYRVLEGVPFSMKFIKEGTGKVVEAEGMLTRDGNKFTLVRTQSTDNINCKYQGQFQADSKTFNGTYTCSNGKTLPFTNGRILAPK